ncbi:TIGR04372 family glycosyltransferase [Lusitaniella coriacea]|uniref:TIGR04372 family glycosyltransferase n=1 Tax=Lusitaniella coriacea TaxID=1983105 RepID=UPI003CF50CB4
MFLSLEKTNSLKAILKKLPLIGDFVKFIWRKFYTPLFGINSFVEKGKVLAEQEKWAEAVANYELALAFKPNWAELQLERGRALVAQGKFDEGIESYQDIINLRPVWPHAYLELGNALAQAGEFDDAIDNYYKAITLKVDWAAAYFYRGNALQCQEKYGQAIEDYQEATDLNFDDSGLYANFGQALAAQGKAQEAYKKLEQALVKLKSNSSETSTGEKAQQYYQIGVAFEELDRSDTAIECYQQAVDLDPPRLESMARLYMNVGARLLALNQTKEALKSYQQVIDIQPQQLDAYTQAGIALFLGGKMEEAVVPWSQGLKVQQAFCQKNKLTQLGTRLLGNSWILAIGHIALLDIYIKMGLLRWRSPQKTLLLVPENFLIPNQCFLDYWQQYITFISDSSKIPVSEKLVQSITDEFWCANLPNGETQIYYRLAATVQQQWEAEQRPPLLSLSDSDEARGWDCLEEMGVPRNAWFVSLHVRESGFHKGWNQRYIPTRDADISTYTQAIESIVARGGWVIRLGDPTMKPLEKSIPQVIDYARSPFKSDWMDIFLCAKSRFFMGTNSGLCLVPPTFGVPCVLTNWTPIAVRPHVGRDIFIPKLYWFEEEQRYLSFAEIIAPPIGYGQFVRDFDLTGIEVVDNTPEEIDAVVVEMLDRQLGQLEYVQEDERLQEQFNTVALEAGSYRGSPIGRDFLVKYAELLEGSRSRHQRTAPALTGTDA